jgi:uncharacterized membrane protein
VGAEPSVVLAGNAGAVVAVVAAAFAANASADRRNRSWRTMHFVLEVVSGVAECSIVGCKRRVRLQLRSAELGVGQLLPSNTQRSPGVVLLEEGREEEVVEVD